MSTTNPKAVPEEVEQAIEAIVDKHCVEMKDKDGLITGNILTVSAVEALKALFASTRQATIKEVVERVRADVIGKDQSEEYTSDMKATWHDQKVADGTIARRNQLRAEQRAALKKIEEEME